MQILTFSQHIANGGIPLTTAGDLVVDPFKHHCRTEKQVAAIKQWHETHPFSFWCGNPFSPDPNGQSYNCTFVHLYYLGNNIQAIKITPNGTIRQIKVGFDMITMHYHFRDILGTKFLNNQNTPMECYEGFDVALALAYQMSVEYDQGVYICREGGTVDMPSYTEVACVRACK